MGPPLLGSIHGLEGQVAGVGSNVVGGDVAESASGNPSTPVGDARREPDARSRENRTKAFLELHRSRLLRRERRGTVYNADTWESPFRVLLVDDFDPVRDTLAEVLRTSGFVVTEATDGFKALEAMELFTFDAVVLDLAMPGLDGRGVLDGMDGQSAPVVLVTASDYASVVEAHGERIFGVMTKPVDPATLIGLVGEAATYGRVSRR